MVVKSLVSSSSAALRRQSAIAKWLECYRCGWRIANSVALAQRLISIPAPPRKFDRPEGLGAVAVAAHNDGMEIHGHVERGVVVLDGGATLPEGTAVTVSCTLAPKPPGKARRVVLPLVKSNRPGSLPLTNERIAEILEQEDVANFAPFFKRPKS